MTPKAKDSRFEERIMDSIFRRSPIEFGLKPTLTEKRGDFEAVLDYGLNGPGPWLVDLSPRTKWDLQDSNLDSFRPWGLTVPPTPGLCLFENGILINRMNRTQCAIWHLGPGSLPVPSEKSYTEITDGLCILAVCGAKALAVMERVTRLDLGDPRLTPPCLLQGPILHIPCQVVFFSREKEAATVLFSFSRGYGQAMGESLMQAGADLGLQPGGEKVLGLS
jgi:hypothetical protein